MTFDNKTLKGKTAVLAVTGSIAAYKIVNLARMLKKLGANVQVLMTKNATEFITPLTFEQLTGNKCLIDTFDRNFQYNVEHVALAKQADVVLVAPASANVIGKIANGIADDMLTTTVMACPCKKIISPAMNHNMYHNPIVQDNIEKLARFGYEIIPPETGMLANGDSGDGRMPDERLLLEYILKEIACEKDLAGTRIQSGRKLCLIVSTDKGNGSVYQVIPGTSKKDKKDFPVHVTVKPEEIQGVLKKETIFMAEQLTIVDERQILMMVGSLEQRSNAMVKVERAMKRQLELEE